MVITNGWYFTQLVNNGFLNELDLSRLPNFFKYASPCEEPSYDPEQALGDLQTGFTASLQHEDDQARDHKFQRLADPAFSGHVE